MKSISKKFIYVLFIAVAYLSGCNEPSDPDMDVMAKGSWELVSLLMDEQVVEEWSNDFILDLEKDDRVVYINHDGIGFTGTWTIDEAGTTLTLTPDMVDAEGVTFNVLYLMDEKMGLSYTVSSTLLGERVFTYVLQREGDEIYEY